MNLNLCLDERPASFDAMVGQEAVVSNLRRQSQTGQFFQCYILEGQFGSGKTTMARILSKAANCEHPDEKGNPCGCCPSCRAVAAGSSDIVELDAASNTGVDSIRQIKESVSYLPVELKKKVYIIDEVHKLSDSAFNALLKVLEEPPKHVMFILCTTEMKKIPATIRSRAACYHFAQISEEKMAHKLIELSEKYRLNYDPAGIDLICMNAAGSMRNALKLLEQSSQAENGISEASVREMLGLTDPVDLFATLDSLIHGSIDRTIPFVRTLLKKGCYPLSMVSDMLSICSDAVVYASTQEMEKKNTAHYRELLGDMCVDVKTSRLCEITNGLMDIYQKLQINADETTLVCGLIAMGGTESARVRTFTYGEMYQYIKNYLKTHARWTDILDYDLTACETNDRKIICAEEELNWEVAPGAEGYYLDISICDYNGEKKPIATLKTLIECDESYRKMVMLGAEFKIAHKSVWLKEKEPYIDRYGYNLVFYSKENKMKYYIHFEGDRQSAVQWAEEKCKEYRKNNQLDSASLFDLKTVTAIRTFQ